MRKLLFYVTFIVVIFALAFAFTPKGLILTYAKAKYGDAESQFKLGSIYFLGTKEGVVWLTKAAESGHVMAQKSLARAYDTGVGVTKSIPDSIRWYRQAAEQNDIKAQIIMAQIYGNGESVPKDLKQSLEWYQRAANNGDAYAQTMMGAFYQDGIGVIRDNKKSKYFYEKAALQNYEYAQLNLGNMMAHSDIKESRLWYLKAVEGNGSPLAKFYLGKSYYNESPPDYTEAIKWFSAAAEMNEVNSLNALGHIYESGTSVPKDLDVAARFYKRSAAQGNKEALGYLQAMRVRYCNSTIKRDLAICSVMYR